MPVNASRPAKQAGYSWICPCLTVRDIDRAIEFCEKAFGFTRENVIPGPNGKTAHGEVRYRDIAIMFGQEGAVGCTAKTPASSGVEPPMGLYVYVDSVDVLYQRATKAGATSVQAPQDMFWGDRICTLKDPDGYQWNFATNVAEFDASKMPADHQPHGQ